MRYFKTQGSTVPVFFALFACHTIVGGCSFDTSGISIKDPGFVCGNGIIEPGQECDDGNTMPGDGCSADCRIETGWVCYGEPSVCHTVCGDGVLVGDEECDDGNTMPGDGCSPECTVEPGWECAGQPSVCTPVCGDGVIGGELECDDGNTMPGDGCSPECTVEPGWYCYGQPSGCYTVCGDGMVAGNEECDDGNILPGDGCSPECSVEPGWECHGEPSVCTPVCGDGVIAGGLECDDGNNEPGDGCSPECTVEPGWYCYGQPSVCYTVCGDGIVAGEEECDDGNVLPGDGCSPTCEIEPYYYCEGAPSVCSCVVLVNVSAPLSPSNGASWPAAYPTVQEGIDHASSIIEASNDIVHCEVWVAEGEYFVRNNSSNDTIALSSNVWVYGGFEGTEHKRSLRDPDVFRTVLDGREHDTSSNHANHVVTASETNNAVLDGFTIQYGLTGDEGAGLYGVNPQNLHIENCLFEHNEADDGGAVFLQNGDAAFWNNTFHGNTATNGHGGGVKVINVSVEVTNSIFFANSSTNRGGGIRIRDSHASIVNSLFYENSADTNGGGISLRSATAEVTNTILRLNSPDQIGTYLSTGNVNYSNVQGGYGGTQNMDADPLFVDPENGDFRLQSGSPCIDAADPLTAPEFDIDGNPRGDTPDIGPYEYQP